MEGISVENYLAKDDKRFDYPTYAKLCKINPKEAHEYRESFNKTQVVSEEESITDTQNIWAEQSTTEEEKTSNLDDKSDKKVVEGEQMVNNVIVRQEDMAELRKIYQERHPEHKQAFGGWGAEELVSRINKF